MRSSPYITCAGCGGIGQTRGSGRPCRECGGTGFHYLSCDHLDDYDDDQLRDISRGSPFGDWEAGPDWLLISIVMMVASIFLGGFALAAYAILKILGF